MQIQDPDLLNKLAEWRRKCADGTITLDEMRESIKILRANRIATADAAAKSKSGSRSKKSAEPVNAGLLLDQLSNL